MPIKFTAEEERIIMGKTLVDANKIEEVKPCIKPVDGDLVRIGLDYGCVMAICCHHPGNPIMYYVTQDGTMIASGNGEVLEIIGKCVFSVYV